LPTAASAHATAQFNLGVKYANGQGVPQNDAEAMRWYRLATEQGHATAQNNVGNMYADGQGVPQDYAEAMKWYRLSAEQG
jgi:TPR repeat protein